MRVSVCRSLVRVAALAILGLVTGSSAARAEMLVALGRTAGGVENALVSFESNTPNTATSLINVTLNGAALTDSLLDIDYRPATGQLYALGNSGTLYTINAATGAATSVATLNQALSGTQFAIDFNPTVDRLRIVSNSGQNLRVDVTSGSATVDGTLNSTTLGTPTTGIVGAAYTNSFVGAGSTTLYDLRYSNGAFGLFMQNPANSGTLVSVGDTGIASLSSLVGFDISGVTSTAYVATNTEQGADLNRVTLSTITLGTGNVASTVTVTGIQRGFQIRGLAAPLGAAVPEPSSLALMGLGLAGVGALARRRTARS